MARKTHKQIAREAVRAMAVDLMDYYRKSLAKMGDGTTKPSELRYVIDSGVKVMGFLEPRADAETPLDARDPASPDQLAAAFGKLLTEQRRQEQDTANETPPRPEMSQ